MKLLLIFALAAATSALAQSSPSSSSDFTNSTAKEIRRTQTLSQGQSKIGTRGD